MECPVCSQRMQLRQMEGVKVDVCDEHGLWLDKGEIEVLVEASRKRGTLEGLSKSMWEVTHY